MMGRVSKLSRRGYHWCDCRHCSPDIQGQRSREKREWIRDQLAQDVNESRDAIL